jgi:serine/threonine-protein kinase
MAIRSMTLARGAASALVIFVCGSARAQANDAAAAEALFNQGKQLMTQGQFAAACPKFAESQRLDPGIGTLLWLGDCYAKNGQLASAWATFHLAESLATKNRDPRESVARDEARKVEPRVSKLVIQVPRTSVVDGLVIKRDDVALGRPLWGTQIPTDAGVHRLAATAPGRLPWQAQVTVPPDGGAVSVSVPSLEAAPQAATPTEERASDGQTQRIVGIGLIGLGVVGAVVGSYFGLRVKSLKDDSSAHCARNVCDQTGFDARQDALTAATISNVAFAVGGVAVVGGVVVFLTAPKGGTSGVRASVGRMGSATGAFLEGSF